MSYLRSAGLAHTAAPCAGKTALITQFVTRMFVAEYNPTIEEEYRTSIDVNRCVSILRIVDTGAQDAFQGLFIACCGLIFPVAVLILLLRCVVF